MDTLYGFIFQSNDEKDLTKSKELIHVLDTPVIYNSDYQNNDTKINTLYSLLLNESLNNHTELDGEKSKFIDTQEYDIFFNCVVRMFYFKTEFIDNNIYLNYPISNLNIEEKEYDGITNMEDYVKISFVWNNQIKFIITNSVNKYLSTIPLPDKYYVVFDESQDVDNTEMYDLMASLCNQLGKENIYRGVKKWDYVDASLNVRYSFYIFYSSNEPDEYVCRELAKNYVVDKFGWDEGELRYPLLFKSTSRRIYPVYQNEFNPISYEIVKNYVDRIEIASPYLIHVLDNNNPLIVEGGLEDVFPYYTPNESGNILNNTFLYYVSSILNYYETGVAINSKIKKESGFIETDDFCTIFCNGIEWQIYKKDYINSLTGYTN